MADGLFGFDFEKQVYNDLLNKTTTPVTHVITELYGEDKSVIYTGDCYSGTGDVIYDNKKIEIKDVSSGKGTYANLGLNKAMKTLDLPLFDLTKYDNFLEANNLSRNKNSKANLFTKEKAKQVSQSSVSEKLKNFDKQVREEFTEQLYEILKNDSNKLAEFMEYIISKKKLGKDIPDTYIVYNHKDDEVSYVYSKQDIDKMKQTSKIELTPTGINFGNIRIQISWKNQVGYNLALYVFIN